MMLDHQISCYNIRPNISAEHSGKISPPRRHRHEAAEWARKPEGICHKLQDVLCSAVLNSTFHHIRCRQLPSSRFSGEIVGGFVLHFLVSYWHEVGG